MNSIVINYSKGNDGVVSGLSEGYSAVARGFDRKRIICNGSALAFFRSYHDSICPVPVKFPESRPSAGIEGTRSGLRTRCGEGSTGRGAGPSVPGAEEEDTVEYGAHILPLDWIISGYGLNFGVILPVARAQRKSALAAVQV